MNIAPTTGGFMMGQKHSSDLETERLRQMELAQIMQHRGSQEERTAQLHPLAMKTEQLGIDQKNAELPGILARSKNDQLTTQYNEATQPGKIADAAAGRKQNAWKHAMSQGQLIAAELDKVQGLERYMALEKGFINMGIPPEFAKEMTGHLASRFTPEQLPQRLRQINEAVLRNTPTYAQAMDQENAQQTGATQRAKIMAENRIDLKGMPNPNGGGSSADKGRFLGTDEEAIQFVVQSVKGKNPWSALQTINGLIAITDPGERPVVYKKLMDMAREIGATAGSMPNNQPNPGTPNLPQLSQGRIPVNTPAQPHVAGQGGAAPQPAPAASSNDLRKRLADAGIPYEPNTYDYRINPATGKLQRSLKGK